VIPLSRDKILQNGKFVFILNLPNYLLFFSERKGKLPKVPQARRKLIAINAT